ncbi:DNA methyltransferase family protein [Sphingomonas abietis]|uniref:Class I SAM-dependent methyltransferase n=1 Tax=Sphingomonas abietis TaxID=3012344 RepID=A0ABY7NQZ2_9SPHN|nr:hypothetical protein [Sphingomonas abietis]WBO23964.1 hypothetical protein PBT88_07595 [Sphingomonas abietis]
MRARGVKITPEVSDVLRRSEIDGAMLRLPGGKLERPLYDAVDKTLKALGGKWNRSKAAHVFDRPIADEIAASLDGGIAIDVKKTNEQFFTPALIAARMCDEVDLRADDHVLEPSAGAGSLLGLPMEIGCFISAVEIDARLAENLSEVLHGRHGAGVWNADFLDWQPAVRAPITVVLMNPPFSGGKDVRHVRRAWDFLAPGGRMAAIMGEHAFFAADRASQDFRMWLGNIGARVENLPAGTFKESGTMVGARLVVATKR